jgi:mono/diheme cytochrome c family protein
VTEIPEHLLKRSRDRRSALGLGGGEGDEGGDTAATPAAPAASTPATTAPAATTPAAPAGRKAAAVPAAAPPPKPDSPVVAAAKRRAKIPFWAMAGLSLLPIWIFMYVRAVTEPPEVAAGPMGIGAEVYTGNCATCHAAGGVGGSGRQLNEGEVVKTFPRIEDHIRFVYFGTEGYEAAGITSYGNPDREGGAHTTRSFNGAAMPAQGTALTGEELLAVVCDERFGFDGGLDPASEDEAVAHEYETWCSDEAPVFLALEAGADILTIGTPDGPELVDAEGNVIDDILPIGPEPVEGSA